MVEYAVAKKYFLARVPDGMGFMEAASVPR